MLFRLVVEEIEGGKVRALLVVESDPFWLFPDRPRLEKALAKLDLLLAMDYLPSKTVEGAQAFFPTATLFETGASFVNQEGRLQSTRPFYGGGSPVIQAGAGGHPPRTFQEEIPGGEPRPAWHILAGIENGLSGQGGESSALTLQGLRGWMVKEFSSLAAVQSFDSPEGVRLLRDGREERVPPSPLNAPPAVPATESLDLYFVDWTFGTEELSGYSPFAQKAERSPSLSLQTADAARLGLREKDRIRISLEGGSLEAEISVAKNMAPGVMIMPRHRQISWQVAGETPVKVAVDKIGKI